MIGSGKIVTISHGSGALSGAVGLTIPWDRVETNGRGVPRLMGHYSPANRRQETPLVLQSGEVVTMFDNRLTIRKGDRQF